MIMKIQKYTLVALAGLMLAGCELKEEMWGNEGSGSSSSVGKAKIDVAVKQPLSMTRAGEVSTADFPIDIVGEVTNLNGDVENIARHYDNVAAIPQNLLLPVGTYTVSSHSKGDLLQQMTEPYYAGSETMKIEKGLTSSVTVTCKMKNSRIGVKYDQSYLDAFSSWRIVIHDGTGTGGNIYTCEGSETNSAEPAEIFWYFGEEKVKAITVECSGITKEGNAVNESRTFVKADAAEKYDDVSEYFEGGDAIVVTMGAVGASSGNITNITINAHVTFENHKDDVEIPTNDPIVIEENGTAYLGTGLTIADTDTEYPEDVKINVTVLTGLYNFFLKMTSTNTDFATYAATLGMTEGDGLDLASSAANTTAVNALLSRPTVGDITYSFVLTEALMKEMQKYPGVHTLTFKATNEAGDELAKQLKVTVTKTGSTVDPNAPTITFQSGVDKITYISPSEISYSIADPPASFDAYISAPKGIQSIMVTIEGGNDAFDAILEDLSMDGQSFMASKGDGVNIVGNTDFNNLLKQVELPNGPEVGATEYNFPIGVFFNFLSITNVTDAGRAHTFNIVITDQEGNKVSDSLKMHLTE